MEKISRKNKAWRSRKSNTRGNTIVVQATNNPAVDELREKMAQMRSKLGFVLKPVSGGSEKENVVKYLSRTPCLTEEYYCEHTAYVVNDHTGGFRPDANISNIDSWYQGQGYISINYCNNN